MKRVSLVRMLSLLLCAALGFGMAVTVLPTRAEAATTTTSLADLLTEGKIKPLGRAQVHEVTFSDATRKYLAADWPASGFEVTVTHTQAQTLKLTYNASYECYWAVHVDGERVQRINYGKREYAATAKGTTLGEIYVHVPAGTHTVSFYKDGGMSDVEAQYWDLYQLHYSGTLENAPANKDLYIEFIGDSYSAGSGTLGQYSAGQIWGGDDHSATHGFPFYTAQNLNADYSVVARGGIGLFVGISDQESTAQKKGMQNVYTYTSGFRTGLGQYGFERRADVVVIELGANDGINPKNQHETIEYWTELLEDFTDTVREKNPTAHIVYLSHNMQKHKAMRGVVEARAESDPKLYAYYFPHSGNGSAAKVTQTAGHPNHFDSQELADGLSNFIATNVLPQPTTPEGTYTDYIYYISETGDNNNDGKSPEKPVQSVSAALTKANRDRGGKDKWAAGERIKLFVSGTVTLCTGQRFDDETPNAPIFITTYNYDPAQDNKAILNANYSGGSQAAYIATDWTFKDITLHAKKNSGGKFHQKLFAAGSNLVFDNCKLTSDGTNWIVAADNFATGGKILQGQTKELRGSVTFRNGDYTNLTRVAAIHEPYLWRDLAVYESYVYDLPYYHASIIIEEGAKMGTVYNRYSKLAVAESTVEIRGGTVNQYIGTASGTGSSARMNISGDVNFVMTGGTLKGERFITTGNYVTLDGNLNNTISGGTIHIVPQGNLAEGKTSSNQYYGFMFGGSNQVTVKDLTNNISGGQFILESNRTYIDNGATKNVDAAFYFGGASGFSGQNVTNNISGGVFLYRQGAVPSGQSAFFFGQHSGKIHGTLTNNISGGIFDNTDAGVTGNFYFGPRATGTAVGKIVNVFGIRGTTKGPRFLSGASTSIQLGAGWNQAGITGSNAGTRDYLPTACTDTVAIHNIIYGGYFGKDVYCSTNGGTNKSTTGKIYYCFINGSVKTEVYGGTFRGTFFGTGNSPVYGKVTTDIYGGYFCSIYGARAAKVYDGVELNIHSLKEYWYMESGCKLYAGGSGGTITATTEGRPALALNITPENPARLTLNMPIYAKGSSGTIDGATTVNVTGGTFPQGFKIEGKTVGECLASGKNLFANPSGNKVAYSGTDASVAGSVIVANDGPSYENEVAYYVSEDGDDLLFGHSPEFPKASLSAAHTQAVLDNRGSNKFPVGTRFVFYVSGEVANNPGASQQLGGRSLWDGTGKIHCPITVTTAADAPRGTIVIDYHAVNPGNATGYIANDYTFRSVDIRSMTNLATGFPMNALYTAGCELTFDDVSITTDDLAEEAERTWEIAADHFSTGGRNPLNTAYQPHYGTLTFKNGDYTNLTAYAVRANNIYRSSGSVVENPYMHCKLIIEEGAHMGTVYNCYGKNQVGSATVEIRGGIVDSYFGTAAGTESAKLTYATNLTTTVSGGTVGSFVGTGDYVDFTGNINNTVTGGTVGSFEGTGAVATITGNVNNTVSGGTITNFAGTGDGTANETAKKVTITGDVTNTISGGTFNGKWFLGAGTYVNINGQIHNVISNGEIAIIPVNGDQKDAIFFAGRDRVTAGSVHNEISGGTFQITYDNTFDNKGKTSNVDSGFYLGGSSAAKIIGDVVNDITGGVFRPVDGKVTNANGSLFLGQYSGTIKGTLYNNIKYLEFDNGGASIGTILYCGGRAVNTSIGSVVNVIGDSATGTGPIMDKGNLSLGAGWAQIGATAAISGASGKNNYPTATDITDNIVVSSTIYGGTFPDIVYSAPTSGTNVGKEYYSFAKGSVETNIYGGTFNEFRVGGGADVFGNVTGNIYGGSFATINISDGVANVKGTKNLTIYGGSFPKGMTLKGTAINAALAPNRGLIEDATGAVLELPDDELTSNGVAVTVKPVDLSLRFTGASVTLYNDLSVGFKADGAPFSAENGYTEPYAEFRCGGVVTKVADYKLDDGRLVFQFSNIAPHRIGDTITATVYATKDGVLYAGKPVRYSVKDYCYNMLVKQAGNEKLAKLLVDLLNYGAAAQNYAGHNTDALVNNGLSEAQKAMGTQAMPTVSNQAKATVNTLEGATVAWKGAGLYLEDAVTVRLTLEAESLEGLTFRFLAGGKTATMEADELVAIEGTTNQYYLYFDMLNAAQMRVPLQVVALRDGEAVSDTVQYSIECYVANKHGAADSTEQLNALLDAMICYGDAAENYVK